MALRTVVRAVSDKLLIGRCCPSYYASTVKVEVPIYEFDSFLLAHFRKKHIFYAYDLEGKCKSGDTVLIKKLDKQRRKLVTHEVMEIIFPLGDVTDPVTGEKCVDVNTRASLKEIAEMYGKLDNGFDYEKAPPRGWQEGKKDMSDKETYIRYHMFNENEEECNDPYAM